MHVINVNRRLIIANKHGRQPSPGSPVYTFYYKEDSGNIFRKTRDFQAHVFPYIMYMWSQSGEKKGRYLPIYSILDQSLSLAKLIRYCENGAAPSEESGKLPELAIGPLDFTCLSV